MFGRKRHHKKPPPPPPPKPPNPLNKYNALLVAATNAVLCDANCMRQRQSDELKQKLQQAETNLASAPAQFETAKKNYYVFEYGEGGYNDRMDKEYGEQAKKSASEIADVFKKELAKTESRMNTWQGLAINYNNVLELDRKYQRDNTRMRKEYRKEATDVFTNDRKTFYEDQRVDGLHFVYKYILWIIYLVVVLLIVYFSFRYSSSLSTLRLVALVVSLIALPFFSTWILGSIIWLAYKAYSVLPKNVYHDL